MEARFLHEGHSIHFIPTEAVSAGSVVILGHLVGIAKLNISPGEFGVIALEGVYEMAKENVAMATGDFAYWDQANRKVTATATGNVYLGRVVYDATATEELVQVRLEPITA